MNSAYGNKSSHHLWSLKCNSAANVASSKHWHVSSLEWDSWTKMVLQPSLAGIHSFHEGITCCLNLQKNTILLQTHLSNKLLWNGVVHCLNSTSWNRLMTLHPTHPSLHVGFDKIRNVLNSALLNQERCPKSGNLQGFPWDSFTVNSYQPTKLQQKQEQ